MRRATVLGWALVLLVVSTTAAHAQVGRSSVLGVSVEEMRNVALGWSVRRQILGRTVFNEKNEKVGVVDDLIIAPDRALSYAIIGAGGFVGLGRHDVAIAVSEFQERNGQRLLEGATKEAPKVKPVFEYANGG